MVNYQNAKIYAIRSYTTDKIYVGSTTQPLSKRMSVHRGHYNMFQSKKYRYMSSFEIIKHGDAYIELLENYPCNSKEDLLQREGKAIRENDCVNKCMAGRSIKEYREENKEQKKAYSKEYYSLNSDKWKTYNQQHRAYLLEKIPCPHCSVLISRICMSRHQQTQKCKSYINIVD